MHRFFVEMENFCGDHCYITSTDDVKHIKKSLRIKEGESIEISILGEEKEYFGTVSFPEDDRVIVENLQLRSIGRESNLEITLYQGLPKSDKLEYIIQKSVELGVRDIIPVNMERTIVKIDKKKDMDKKLDRWNKISYEAAKQSKRTFIPEIKEIISFKDMIASFKDYDLVVFLYEGEENLKLKDMISGKGFSKISVIVGPEGGFSEKEAEEIKSSGGSSISLGRRILRTETAGMVCISILQYELGDMG